MEASNNRRMTTPHTSNHRKGAEGFDVFLPGAPVLLTLSSPREKFWGAIIAVSAAGVSVRGVGLESFEDFARQVRDGEPVNASAAFFPMHRLERMELDERNGDVPSMVERFHTKTGHDAADFLLPGSNARLFAGETHGR